MSKDTITNLTVKVPDYSTHTKAETQYGMTYPDGTIKWVSDADSNGSNIVHFDRLHLQYAEASNRWDNLTADRAKRANIDVAEYRAQHTPIRRTVVLAVTEAEAL